MRVLIIGASGFIGNHLVQAAVAQGIKVRTLSRTGARAQGVEQAFEWSFGRPVPEAACKGVECAIHLAHDFNGEEGARRTVESTLAIVSQLKVAGVRRQLFFSSYSAGEHASSLYGRTKYILELDLAPQADIVIVRPGLVLGNGGIYERIRKWAQLLPIIPLPDGGRGDIPVIQIEKLCELTLKLVSDPAPPAEANLFERKLKTLRQLTLEAASEAGRKPWILPVPSILLIIALKLAAQLRIPLPVNADNLAGFMANQSARHTSAIEKD